MVIAKQAAGHFRARGATRVLLFGSLANGTFDLERSDSDIYFAGLDDNRALDHEENSRIAKLRQSDHRGVARNRIPLS